MQTREHQVKSMKRGLRVEYVKLGCGDYSLSSLPDDDWQSASSAPSPGNEWLEGHHHVGHCLLRPGDCRSYAVILPRAGLHSMAGLGLGAPTDSLFSGYRVGDAMEQTSVDSLRHDRIPISKFLIGIGIEDRSPVHLDWGHLRHASIENPIGFRARILQSSSLGSLDWRLFKPVRLDSFREESSWPSQSNVNDPFKIRVVALKHGIVLADFCAHAGGLESRACFRGIEAASIALTSDQPTVAASLHLL